MTSLHDRLLRMRRPPLTADEPVVDDQLFAADESLDETGAERGDARLEPAFGLTRLEQDMLGAVEDGLTLKERLERLVAATTARGARDAIRSERLAPLEELVDGLKVENECGEFFLMKEDIALESWHGDVSLSRFRALSDATVEVLTADAELSTFDLREAAFLDTETTGLAGGAGTAAFLIGVGYVEGDHFRVRQYFMRDYHEEGALLHALAEDLSRFRRIVTFNGKMFDLPLLEARYRLNRSRFPLSGVPHFDLLHPARRLWKARIESCRLQSLEAQLIGLRRGADIPGEHIPQVYFDWVRRRDARALVKVFRHNRDDIVSLAALSILACQWVEEHRAEDPRDVLSLARVLERARLYERSDEQYRRAVDHGKGPLRNAALLGLAARSKRARDFGEAAGLWAAAAEAGEPLAMHELAMHHEHRTRDLDAALGVVDRALDVLDGRDDPKARRMAQDFWRRRARLVRKQGRASTGSPSRGTPPPPER
ncbi:MAG TPA: ribonuclease H-like domain-containing protein [Vicinamibacteria bacterium]|nr:ribonuclease H-like domain-containing protein [Vicinamibacteria bacterium]